MALRARKKGVGLGDGKRVYHPSPYNCHALYGMCSRAWKNYEKHPLTQKKEMSKNKRNNISRQN